MEERKPNTLQSSGTQSAQDEGCADCVDAVSVGVQAGGAELQPAQATYADATADDAGSSAPGPGTLIDGKYRVEHLIARGGMGAVYAATHVVSGKKVALKWMLPALGQIKGARERFIQEACATARIAHPNIVDIYDVGGEHDCAYLVMEYLRGETLADRMCRERLSVTDAIALLMPALRGIAAAHAHGVVHRDIKPENIFLCRTEQGEELEPKVLDFGISKITTDEVRSLALTHSGAVLGTPYYMSPEQVRGARDVDARADVYAIGVILFETLTGERPFEAETYNELILKIATAPVPNAAELNPSLDARLVAIVERAMARDPNERFLDVKQLALALEPFGGGVRFRSMHTLNNFAPVSGDYPVAPAHAGTAAPSVAPDPVTEHGKARAPTPRGTRLAMLTAVLSLLTSAAVALYFIAHPEAPKTQLSAASANISDAAPTPAAQRARDRGAPGRQQRSHDSADGLPEQRSEHAQQERDGDRSAATSLDTLEQPQTARTQAAEIAPPEPSAATAPLTTSGGDGRQAGASLQNAVRPTASATGRRPQLSGSNWARRAPRATRAPVSSPASEPSQAPAPLVVRALSNDWDRRLDQHDEAPASVHMPAGHIDIDDFH